MTKHWFGFLLIAGALACSLPVAAQTQSDIAMSRAELQAERQAIVTANLDLTDGEALAFWPLYRDYRVDMARVGDRLVKLITDYAAKRDTLTDAEAATMLDEMLSIQSDELSVKKKFQRVFGKVLSPKKVARFYQIENKIDALIRVQIADVVPLVR